MGELDLMPYQKIVRGDIIVFHYPVDPQQHFVKRVIGVPGDQLANGQQEGLDQRQAS